MNRRVLALLVVGLTLAATMLIGATASAVTTPLPPDHWTIWEW